MSTITDKDFVWLNRILTKYGNKDSVLDVSELDGMLTAIITGPTILPLTNGCLQSGAVKSIRRIGNLMQN